MINAGYLPGPQMLGRYQICPPFARDLRAGQISDRFDISHISARYLPGPQIQNLPTEQILRRCQKASRQHLLKEAIKMSS